jgi:hypothetical protein
MWQLLIGASALLLHPGTLRPAPLHRPVRALTVVASGANDDDGGECIRLDKEECVLPRLTPFSHCYSKVFASSVDVS